MANKSAITYTPRPDAESQSELGALAAIYKLCLESRARNEAAPDSRPDAGTRIKGDSDYVSIIPE